MADYQGLSADIFISPRSLAFSFYSDSLATLFAPVEFSTEKFHSGSSSLLLHGGHVYSINIGCDSGSRTISFYAWPEASGAKVRAELYDPDTGELLASSLNSGSGAWEKIELNFTAEKKVYILRIVNYSNRFDASKNAWIDDLVLA